MNAPQISGPARRTSSVAVPQGLPPDELIGALREELARHGSVRPPAGPYCIEFDGPGVLAILGSPLRRGKDASGVKSGTVWVDPLDPATVHLELRYHTWAPWIWPALMSVIFMSMDLNLAYRLLLLGLYAAWPFAQLKVSRKAYEAWIAEAARRAGTP